MSLWQTRGDSKPTNGEDIELNPNHEPSSDLDELEVFGRTGTMFNDLFNKNIKKSRQEPHKTPPNSRPSQITTNVDTGNTGDGDVNGEGAKVRFGGDIHVDEKDSLGKYKFRNRPNRLKLFESLVKTLEEMPRVADVEFISTNEHLGNSEGKYSFFPTTYSNSSRASNWQYINYIKGYEKPDRYKYRKSLIAKISLTNQRILYLGEIERRVCEVGDAWIELDSCSMLYALSPSYIELYSTDLQELLESCVYDRGKWDLNVLTSNFKTKALVHASNQSIEEGAYIARQIGIIEKHLGFEFD